MQDSNDMTCRPRTAGELMATPPITLNYDCTVADVARMMVDNSVGSMMLVDDEGMYRGIITENSFLPTESIHSFMRGTVTELMGVVIGTEENFAYDEAIDEIKAKPCAKVMNTSIPTVMPSTPAGDIAAKMASSGSHHIPVLVDGKPVGMVARHDLLQLFYG